MQWFLFRNGNFKEESFSSSKNRVCKIIIWRIFLPLFQDFRDVLSRYNEVVGSTVLSGPTSFGPIIRRSVRQAPYDVTCSLDQS
jgi:hypothetical protein